ncbi:MAG TPA: MBL fold metallo-hydrolase [Klebsiella sp.]|jgi:glyoxylase-like metal-dependent hydrolase (beta-lactamase superfamily II)
MIKLCATCGTSYDDRDKTLNQCPVCEDERQYVPVSGQRWVKLDDLVGTHVNQWQQHNSQLLSLKTVPKFAIDQRAFLILTPQGNILWDCIANLDAASKTLITALGGIKAIAISHPHYYTTMQDWAEAFNARIYLHASDREWIMRDSPAITLWTGDVLEILPAVRLLRLGGHFAGGTVLHWAKDAGIMLAGDIIQVTPGADAVSFMWSYPNMLPLAAASVEKIMERLDDVRFEALYGAFEGQNVTKNARQIVINSAQKYLTCLNTTANR